MDGDPQLRRSDRRVPEAVPRVLLCLCRQPLESAEAKEVTLDLLLGYQHALFSHRKRDGEPLSFGTQAQRLVPITQFFAWLHREHRIVV